MRDFVYIIGHKRPDGGIRGPIKVGITTDPDQRLKQFKTAAPFPIGFLCVFALPTREIAFDLERKFHEQWASERTNGEWFNIGPLDAACAIADEINRFLNHCWCEEGMLSPLDLWDLRNRTGVYAVEQKLAGERYLLAWEGTS